MEHGSALMARVAEDGIQSKWPGGDGSGKKSLAERLTALEPFLSEIFYRFGVLDEFRDVTREVANRETHQVCLENLYRQLAKAARCKAGEALDQGHMQLAVVYAVESATWAEAARLANINS